MTEPLKVGGIAGRFPPARKDRAVFVGIDPGASGGVAFVSDSGASAHSLGGMTMSEVWGLFAYWLNTPLGDTRPFAVIEKNTGYVGGAGNPGSAMFKFGASHGALLMALTAALIPFEEVTPRKWQRVMGIPPRKGKEAKAVFKRRLKAKAQALFPDLTVMLATADALLLAEYARRTFGRW